jgi:hypothetical protein
MIDNKNPTTKRGTIILPSLNFQYAVITITEPDVSWVKPVYIGSQQCKEQTLGQETFHPNKLRKTYAYDHKPIEKDYCTHTQDS